MTTDAPSIIMRPELILPPGVTLSTSMEETVQVQETAQDVEGGKYLPRPVGYKLLCAVPDMKETYEGTTIVRPDAYAQQEAHATVVLFVLDVGDMAYSDKEKFPTGPWCKKGDFVLVRTYAGTRFKVFGKEFRVLNDDQIECVVDDPRGVERV